MASLTNAERIIRALAQQPGLDDDQLARAAEVHPRQTVNQICRRMKSENKIRREIGTRGKIINNLIGKQDVTARPSLTSRPVIVLPKRRPKPTPIISNMAARVSASDPAKTLFIIPCSSAKKAFAGRVEKGPSILDEFPSHLAERLANARSSNADYAQIDEASIVPAWQRYRGTLYEVAGPTLGKMVDGGRHVLILSGGYGVVLANEPIGNYDARFKASLWPRGVIEDALSAYALRHRLKHVRAIVSATTAYRKIVERTDWQAAGVEDAILITPQTAGGAMRKAPRAQGEILVRLSEGCLPKGRSSSDGLGAESQRLA